MLTLKRPQSPAGLPAKLNSFATDGPLAKGSRLPQRRKRDGIELNRHRALAYYLSMIFSENRSPLFRIML
jgi:hypothetical protein